MSRPLRIHQQMLSMGLDLVLVVADERWELALEVRARLIKSPGPAIAAVLSE